LPYFYETNVAMIIDRDNVFHRHRSFRPFFILVKEKFHRQIDSTQDLEAKMQNHRNSLENSSKKRRRRNLY